MNITAEMAHQRSDGPDLKARESEKFKNLFEKMKSLSLKGYLPIEQRKKYLLQLRKFITENSDIITTAVRKDFNRPTQEIELTELAPVLSEINVILKNLKKWTSPKKVKSPITLWGGKYIVKPRPKGVVLIISPWNYPFSLAITPLISAFASGNRIILKPSEQTPYCSRLIKEMIEELFSDTLIKVIEGPPAVAGQLLELPFDHIFFTGPTHIGKLIMNKASKYLTPITLELGGKSPVLIDHNVDLELAAKKIVWGKFVNAGQTCVAPDYVLLPKQLKEPFEKALIKNIESFFGKTELNRIQNSQYSSIINLKHFNRLKNLFEKIEKSSVEIILGGTFNSTLLKISPTIISQVSHTNPIMQEEIFGPFLPLITYDDWDNAVQFINERPRPLALYLFSKNKEKTSLTLNQLCAGGVCINDTLIHAANPYLPFGGIGLSGMGSYHGEFGMRTFSHWMPIAQKNRLGTFSLFYPPYSVLKKHLYQVAIKKLSPLL